MPEERPRRARLYSRETRRRPRLAPTRHVPSWPCAGGVRRLGTGLQVWAGLPRSLGTPVGSPPQRWPGTVPDVVCRLQSLTQRASAGSSQRPRSSAPLSQGPALRHVGRPPVPGDETKRLGRAVCQRLTGSHPSRKQPELPLHGDPLAPPPAVRTEAPSAPGMAAHFPRQLRGQSQRHLHQLGTHALGEPGQRSGPTCRPRCSGPTPPPPARRW